MHRISIYCIKHNCIFFALYQKFDIYEPFATQRKSDRKMQPPLLKYYKEFCKWWSRSEQWLALDLHKPLTGLRKLEVFLTKILV